MKHNEYIIHGYRIKFDSFTKVFKSLFMVHNESVNVWTHLIGAIIVIICIFYTAVFIHYHHEIITNFDFSKVNAEIKEITSPIFPGVSKYASSLYDKTKDVIHGIDEKISEFADFTALKINCISCAEDILKYFSDLKDSVSDSIKNAHIKEEFEHILNYIRYKEAQWINIYTESTHHKDDAFSLSKIPLYFMLLGAVICLGFSAIFHLFIAHSEKVNNLFNRLDYAGISILIVGSCYPPNYYLFNCDIGYAYFYLTFMTTMGIIVFVISIREEFTKKEYHKIKGILFLSFGISAGLPVIHLNLFSVNGFDLNEYDFTLWFIGGLSYIFGALIYILKFPERFWPGRFCIVGNSHQIFHVMVLIGVFSHYMGSLESYLYRSNNSCIA